MRFRLRTLLVILLLAPPLVALYITVVLAARDVALDRELLDKERAAFEMERVTQQSSR